MLIQVVGGPIPRWRIGDPSSCCTSLCQKPPLSWTRLFFDSSEDTRSYLEWLVRQGRIPLYLYGDRHSVSKYNTRQGPVIYESTLFARVLRELDIQQIFALSPQDNWC